MVENCNFHAHNAGHLSVRNLFDDILSNALEFCKKGNQFNGTETSLEMSNNERLISEPNLKRFLLVERCGIRNNVGLSAFKYDNRCCCIRHY